MVDSQLDIAKIRYLYLTNNLLPSIAADRKFPVRHNHCFQRIVLDNLFGGCWYDFLKRGRIPAYKQLSLEQLNQAIAIAQSLVDMPVEHCQELNAKSLQWRGKTNGRT